MSKPEDKIETLAALECAVERKQAVVCPGSVWEKPKPAAVLMNLPGRILLRLFLFGMYIYKKQGT